VDFAGNIDFDSYLPLWDIMLKSGNKKSMNNKYLIFFVKLKNKIYLNFR